VSEHEQEFDDKDFEEAAAEDGGLPDAGEPATEPIQFSPEILTRSRREFDTVEFNLSTGECRIVEKSKAKRLGKAVMKERGAVIQKGQTVFDGGVMEVDVYHGRPLGLQIAHEQLLDEYRDREREAERDDRLKEVRREYKGAERDTHIQQIQEEYKDLVLSPEQRIEREDRAKRLILAGMIVIDGMFSFEGRPADALTPIDDMDEILLNALWSAYNDVNNRFHEEWYSVEVRRGTPLETKLMLNSTFESYQLGTGESPSEMTEETLEDALERSNARRNILVSSMIVKPALSLGGKGAKHAYPIEDLSEQMLQCLHAAYSIVNSPSEGLKMLRRFPRRREN